MIGACVQDDAEAEAGFGVFGPRAGAGDAGHHGQAAGEVDLPRAACGGVFGLVVAQQRPAVQGEEAPLPVGALQALGFNPTWRPQ
jgi:hypothetical protein